jgi:hypothetical protein
MGLNPDEIIDFFNGSEPSNCTVTLGTTQPINRNEYQELKLVMPDS